MTFFKKRESSSLNSKVGQSDGEAEVKKREGCDVELVLVILNPVYLILKILC